MGPEIILIIIGVVCGTMAGLIGIAGGMLLIPALVLVLGYTQKLAQGTTLAVMMLPIGVGAVYFYYRSGNVNFKAVVFIAAGFVVGGLLGALGGSHLSDLTVARVFGAFALAVGVKMLFFP